MRGIARTFNTLKEKGEGVLIGYVMAGDPSIKGTIGIVEALVRGGIDILELGVPFSDPIADGPTIQAAALRALKAGTTPFSVLEMARDITSRLDLPVVLLSYFNPVFKAGLGKFICLSKESGIAGLIIPDLPVEEATEYRKAAMAEGLDTIFLAAPSTTLPRFYRILESTSGFIYLVSVFGVTGTREEVQDLTMGTIKRFITHAREKVPLAVGFGISQPSHVGALIDAGVDGVIVGSAFVKIVEENLDSSGMLRLVEKKAQQLKAATVGRLRS